MTTSSFGADAHGQDTFAWLSEPDRPHGGLDYAIHQDAAAIKYTYWPGLNNIPKDAVVDSAHYYTNTAGDWAGPVTLGLNALEDSWNPATCVWNNRPGIVGATVEVTHSPSGPGTEYDFNCLTMVASMIAAGTSKGFGLRRTDPGDAVRTWQRDNVNVPTTQKDRLIVVWHAAGQKPARLQPDGIVGVPSPLLTGFPRDTQAVRAFADPDEDGFASPTWSSGTIPVTAPELDLNTVDGSGGPFPGTVVDGHWWWQVSCQDQQGNWSDPSDPVKFTYVPLPELTLLNPAEDNPVVTDVSFPIIWDVDDQKSCRAWVTKNDGSGDELWSSGRIQDPDLRSITVPAHGPLGHRILRSHEEGFYRAWIASYPSDTNDRVAVPGAQAYSREARVFTLVSVPGVPPMSTLYVTQNDQGPQVNLHATRDAGAPDGLNVWRDGELIMDGIDPDTVLDFDEYVIIDYDAAPNTPHEWYIQAVVNGNASVPGPHATFTPTVHGYWLTDHTRGLSVCGSNHPDGSPAIQSPSAIDQATVTYAIGAEYPDTDTEAIGRMQFTLHVVLSDDDPPGGRTAQSYEHDLYVMKNNPEIPVMLHYQNKAYPVTVADVVPVPYDSAEDTSLDWQVVDITVRQVGPWTIYPDNTDNGGISDPLAPDFIYRYADEGLEDGDPLTVGLADITATAGSPVGDDDAIVPGHTDTEGWVGGSITRATPNTAAFSIDVYFMVPGTLPDGSSITLFKTPAEDDPPVDIRLRTKGVIDCKMQDGTITGTSSQKWIAGKWYRCNVVGTWDAISGQMNGSAFLYLKGDGEYQDADSILPISGVTTSPTNFTHGSPDPDDPVMFEVERVWTSAVIAGPYGTPPPAPPLNPAATLIRPGVAGNDWAMFAVYTGDAQIFDTIALNVATNSGMTSPTLHAGGAHNSGGFNVFTATSLAPATRYWAQAVLNGTPHGPVVSLWTTQVAGTPCTIRRAVGGCQQDPPASTAAFDDIVTWAVANPGVRLIHQGDDTYPNTLSDDPFTHWVVYALSMSDTWSQVLAAAGIGINKIISDHDVNGSGQSNLPNFNDPVTQASLTAWAQAVPAPMHDVRVPKVGRYWSEVEGNVRFVYLDERNTERTDVRMNGVPPDSPTSWHIDSDQEDWLYAEATLAATSGQLLIVIADTQFLGTAPYATEGNKIPVTYSDKWGSCTVQRDRIDETLASIMPITDGHPNVEIWSSDGHGLQFGVTANGIKVRTCGPLHQQLHLHFQSDYDTNYPSNTKGDSYGGGGNNTAKRTQYMRMTIAESPAGTWTVTADMRECSTKVVGDTPTTVHTDTTVYSISGDVVGDHLFSLVGVPS